jgi:hypothetical protein
MTHKERAQAQRRYSILDDQTPQREPCGEEYLIAAILQRALADLYFDNAYASEARAFFQNSDRLGWFATLIGLDSDHLQQLLIRKHGICLQQRRPS